MEQPTAIPDGNATRYELNGRAFTCSLRCIICAELGRYDDTRVCEACEVYVAEHAGEIRAAREKALPPRASEQ